MKTSPPYDALFITLRGGDDTLDVQKAERVDQRRVSFKRKETYSRSKGE